MGFPIITPVAEVYCADKLLRMPLWRGPGAVADSSRTLLLCKELPAWTRGAKVSRSLVQPETAHMAR